MFAETNAGSLLCELAAEEIPHVGSDLAVVRFQREMACVKEVYLSVRNVFPVRFRAGRQEENVVLAPHGKHGRTVCAPSTMRFG